MSDPPHSSPARTDDELARTDDELDSLLDELSRASRDIAPSADFKLAITRAIEDDIAQQITEGAEQPAQPHQLAPAPSWLDGVARSGRFAFVAAAAAAALALWWSSEVQNNFDDEVLATFDVVEVVE